MSHITHIAIEVSDLDATEAACKEIGAELRRNQTHYQAYHTQHPCAHAIRVPGVSYEIGLVPSKDSPGKFTLQADFYGYEGSNHDGHKLKQKFGGESLPRLRQLYGVHSATQAARKKGYLVQRQQNGHKINLLINV